MTKSVCKNVYIHIPFCKKRCKYCSFVSFENLNLIDEYIEALIKEIKLYNKQKLDTLYIGGGTPSLLDKKHYEKIFDAFKFENNPEITVELNPESTNKNDLKYLKNLGVNRVSIGIQSFDDDILRLIGRLHSGLQAKSAIKTAKNIFDNVSIDLIYGLPTQNIENWEKTLDFAIEAEVGHISLYGLKIEKGSYFYKYKPKDLPNDDTQAQMYEIALKKLNKYSHYEISNFASDETKKSRHNQIYWHMKDYWGFGVSASGFINGSRYQNTTNLNHYIKNPTAKVFKPLTNPQKLEETIFLGFRMIKGIDVKKINEKFKINFDKKYHNILNKYLQWGYIKKTSYGYKLSDKGILVSNNILCDFLED